MTQPFHVNLAKKELTDYVMSEIRKIYWSNVLINLNTSIDLKREK
jgi:hypothetical protein